MAIMIGAAKENTFYCKAFQTKAAFHKECDMQNMVHAGHTLLDVPPYFPDLHPIEKMAPSQANTKNYALLYRRVLYRRANVIFL